MYPITIVDDFFPDPDKIVDIIETYNDKSGKMGENSDRWKPKLFTQTNKERKCPVAFLFK